MKTTNIFLAVTAAALLCLLFLPCSLRAQDVAFCFPENMYWTATQVAEQVLTIDTDQEWEIYGYGSDFSVDQTEGLGSEYVHIHPNGPNTGTADRVAYLYVRTTSGPTYTNCIVLRQFAPEGGGGGGGGDPTPDPVERISLAGNWTLTRTYTNAAGTASFEDITFYDGLGYAEQVVQVGASPSGGKNIVTPVWYDSMRRSDARSYLPYVSTNNSRIEESASSVLSSQAAWYNANGWAGQGAYAFAEQEYEASPLDRVLKARKPGSTYAKAVNGSKAVQMTYAANAASEVRKLSLNSSGGLVLSSGYYGAGTLHKVTSTDEDGCVSVTWTDALGRTVLTRQQSATNVNLDTYYVYDDAGHLCWVISPVGSTAFGTSTVWNAPASTNVNDSNAARYCYIYTWDGRGRQLSRKIPGKAVEYFVYDRDGRLVMSQDGLQRAASRWVTYKYDDAGRLVRRALLSSSQSRQDLQSTFDSGISVYITPLMSGGTTLDSFDYGSYTNASYNGLSFSTVSGIVSASDVDTDRIKGLKTYEKVAILSGTGVPTTYVQRAFYYDALGRLVQTVEANAMGSTSRYSTKYDFLGAVTASREQHGNDHKASTFTYDTRGRLLSESTSVNGSVTASMAYAYDPLGRLKTTTSGSGTNAVTTTDTFNIQGWLASRMAVKGSGNNATNIFSMSLGYYTPVQTGATARYSGDISSWAWTQSGQDPKAYAFSYDKAHRLTAGQFYDNGTATNAFSEKAITYDRAGNLTKITRYNDSGSGTTLLYSYTGNRLSSIGTASYAYDADGNLTTDGRRGISLTYNLLGRPAGVTATVGGAAKANYSYLSDGSKTGVAKGTNGYWYLGSFVYNRGNVLESVAFGGGRILKNGSAFVVDYHISDHLGSVRAVVRNGAVIEQNDYYPFGSRHDSGLAVQSSPVANRYRYNGKELQTTGSLGYLDYGARFYDPDIARWNRIDPLAGEQQAFSPYSFCGGNPILQVDADGQVFETVWDAASLVMGVKSFVQNVKEGNVGAAIMDGVGIIGDALAVATPLVPGGVSAGIAAVRVGKNIDHAVDAAKALDRAGDLAKTTDKTSNVVNVLNKTDNTEKTYQTYMKVNQKTGEVYIGRTGGTGSPRENVLKRDRNHHMNEKGYGPAVLINSSKNQDAIRGQEQYLIDLFGGAKSKGGNAGNAINGVSPTNPKRRQYEEARLKEFGQ